MVRIFRKKHDQDFSDEDVFANAAHRLNLPFVDGDDVLRGYESDESSVYAQAKHAHVDGGKNAPKLSRKQRFAQLPLPKKIVFIVVCVFLAIFLAGLIFCIVCLQGLPETSDAESFNTTRPTEVYASDRTTLLARFQLENRTPVDSLSEIDEKVCKGTVATEDERFYKHFGVDPIGIGRAILNNLGGGTLEGASTITQQLVRNTVLADEMGTISIARKIREAYLAVKMETMYKKDDILLLYLNTVNYGSGAYGIEAAAQRYFSKSAKELTLNEAATLVGIPQSPTYNNPIDFMDHAINRRNIVLQRMVSYGMITQEEADAASREEITINPSTPSNDGILQYPYFASYVRSELLSMYDLNVEDVFKGGMTVYTTLDLDAQKAAEAAATEKLQYADERLSLALVAVDTESGYIKAMVGGQDYYQDQWNLATQATRQPGSSFKTYTLVAALENGVDPATPVSCPSKILLSDYNESVSNFGGINYGTRSIERAFHVSSNTGFVRLQMAVGADKVIDAARRMGITTDLTPVPSLTLGACSCTPLEMASAYACVANGGTHYQSVSIETAYDRRGKLLIDNTHPEGEKAISKEVAQAARDIMRGVISSGEGTGTAARLDSGQDAIGKTGTSENYRDSWFVGCIPQLSVAIWMGDRQNRVSTEANGGSVADVFSAFLNPLLEGKELTEFPTAGYPTYTRKFSNTALDTQTKEADPSPSASPESSPSPSASSGASPKPTVGPTVEPSVDPEPSKEPDPTSGGGS